jgi:hypothetical protein
MALTAEQRQHLLTKAMKDEAFREALLHDARAAVQTEFPLALPPGDTLHVLAPGATDVFLVLPPYPADWPAGLSVADLEQRLTQDLGGLNEKQQQRYPRVIAKAWHDASFRQALLQDPATVLQQELGVTLPADVTLRAVAEDAHTQYLILPPLLSEMELTDEQLEQVAGGEFVTAGITLAVALTVVLATASAYATVRTFTDW